MMNKWCSHKKKIVLHVLMTTHNVPIHLPKLIVNCFFLHYLQQLFLVIFVTRKLARFAVFFLAPVDGCSLWLIKALQSNFRKFCRLLTFLTIDACVVLNI